MIDKIRTLIADDHAPTRDDIRAALASDERFTLVAEVADAASAIEAAVREMPHLCLLDIHMPGNGCAAAWEISGRLPETKIVMLTVSSEESDLFAALRAGASGYLLKDIDPARLPHALADVMRGEAAIPRTLVARILEELRDRSPRRRSIVRREQGPELTSREWEVLELLRQGHGTGDIANRLSVSATTVRSHVAGVLRKLRVPDRESAIRLMEADSGT